MCADALGTLGIALEMTSCIIGACSPTHEVLSRESARSVARGSAAILAGASTSPMLPWTMLGTEAAASSLCNRYRLRLVDGSAQHDEEVLRRELPRAQLMQMPAHDICASRPRYPEPRARATPLSGFNQVCDPTPDALSGLHLSSLLLPGLLPAHPHNRT